MFKLGRMLMTAGISAAVKEDAEFDSEIAKCLLRHSTCDWGDLCEEDSLLNDDALISGDRILSAYKTTKGKVWIITEADRSATTILFPSEY